MKRIFLTCILTVFACALALHVMATSGVIQITVDPSIKILVNGEEFKPKDVTGKSVMTFVYDGTTYAPLRALAEAYGLEVGYNAELKMATVNKPGENQNADQQSTLCETPTYWQQKALENALDWLNRIPDSPKSVERILRSSDFQDEEISYVLSHPDINWNDIATNHANRYYSELPRDSVIRLLEISGFTQEQAAYAADHYTKNESSSSSDKEPTTGEKNALKKAKQYLDLMPFSEKGLIEQLKYDGFYTSEAEYAVEHCGADWYEQAVNKASVYLDIFAYSREGLISQLEYDGFTNAQASYGASQNGY